MHVPIVTLSHSRKGCVEAVLNQSAESFLRSLENAFRHFGGVPERLCPDNLKAAVIKADWYEPEINPKLRDFAAHYGAVILPSRPRTPMDKGKVEAAVKYVKNNALKGKSFSSLAEVNEHLRWWTAHVAGKHIHGTTKRQVGTCFEEEEKASLRPLPGSLLPCNEEGRRSVHRDSFDFSFNPGIDRRLIHDLATGRFLEKAEDIVLIVPPGVGKSHLSQAICHELIKSGKIVLYRSIFDLLGDLRDDSPDQKHERTMKRFLKCDLLIIDDMGIAQLPPKCGEYLFEIIMRRYEVRSTLMTSNPPLEEWGKLIGDVPATTDILDRFLHHAKVIKISGKSYRMNQFALNSNP